MKSFTLASLLVLALVTLAFAADADVDRHRSCTYCGMDRATFAHSRVLIEYDDGSSVGACSLRCAAVDLANHLDKTPRYVGVGDYYSKKLIDAEKAFWVIGGSRSGVMTSVAKWAFEKSSDAERFVAENGGRIVTFEQAIEAAYEDMYRDTKQIRERRKLKRMKMGAA